MRTKQTLNPNSISPLNGHLLAPYLAYQDGSGKTCAAVSNPECEAKEPVTVLLGRIPTSRPGTDTPATLTTVDDTDKRRIVRRDQLRLQDGRVDVECEGKVERFKTWA